MAEQLETLINAKQRLLQDISHVLRSPLAHLADTEFIRMEEERKKLNTLIGEALDYARLDKSTNTLHTIQVDLPSLLKSIFQDANYEY